MGTPRGKFAVQGNQEGFGTSVSSTWDIEESAALSSLDTDAAPCAVVETNATSFARVFGPQRRWGAGKLTLVRY